MRINIISVLGFLSAVVASAGTVTIPIGGSTGLTSSYISSGCAGVGPCVSGSVGSFSEANYDVRLFQAATNSTYTPYPTYNGSTAETGVLGPSGLFSMIDDGVGSFGSNNLWYAHGANAIDIPVGLSNVKAVDLMLNDIWGIAGASETVVTFDFANTSNGSTVDQVVVDLTNSGVAGSAASGQIRSAVDCSSVCGSGGNNFASGPILASSTPTTLVNGVLQGTGILVNTLDLFTAAYGPSNIASTSVYANTSGNVNLDAQGFQLGAYSGLYLTQILVSDPNAAGTVSQTALSAVTVIQNTPEPSTIMLLMAGLGTLGYARFRRK